MMVEGNRDDQGQGGEGRLSGVKANTPRGPGLSPPNSWDDRGPWERGQSDLSLGKKELMRRTV